MFKSRNSAYSTRSSHGHASFRGRPRRPVSGRSFGSRKRGAGGERIEISKFINKRVSTIASEQFTPKHLFTTFGFEEKLKENIVKKGYSLPTPIQDSSIPEILNGRDVVALANTGTGKTAAFLLPLINKILLHRDESVLIVAPTRELALQIDQELLDFSKYLRIHSVVCVGGAPIGKQMSELRSKPHFLIGTPGRIKDLMDRKRINLSTFRTVVLDEADRMLDMGFVGDMRIMMSAMPKERQTLFFSATVSPQIESLIKEFLTNPVKISVKTQDTSENVEQDIVRVSGKDKIDVLSGLLKNPDFNKVLVFGKTKHGVEKLSETLIKKGFKAGSIHGNKTHGNRQRALGQFKDNNIQVLVATDVAARGLDVKDISHVINYDIPMTYADYTHRIGRTGRGDKKGKALTFVP